VKKILFFAFLLIPLLQIHAQYTIKGRIVGAATGSYVLAHYFGYSQYIAKDTAQLNANGELMFEDKNKLPSGLYLLLNPKKQKMLEFVMGNEQVRTRPTTRFFISISNSSKAKPTK
jgi:hypothetical protein